jgi:RNA polymerase sigma factor (TIGR02999 family)
MHMSNREKEIKLLLGEVTNGSKSAYSTLFSIVYDRLRDLAHRQIVYEPNLSLTKTALVHELYLKMFQQKVLDIEDRYHFFAIAARCMRQILIDHARTKTRVKRGGNQQEVTYIDEIISVNQESEDLLQIDRGLEKLANLDRRMADIVELHYFGEMNFKEIAKYLDLSERTVYREWAKARAWLYREMKKQL